MEKTRVAIIGTGGISNMHMGGYKALSDTVEVVACCDIDREKAEKYAAGYGIPAVYESYDEMFEKEKIDAVSVCTWNSAHKGAAIAALRAGANVICEKPMAMNRFEAEEMKNEADKAGRLLMIGFVRRFGRDAQVLKSFIDGGRMGDIYYAKATYLRRNGCPGRWFGDKAYSGGGPLIDLGVHVIDLVRYLAGRPKPTGAYGVTYNNLGCDRASGVTGWVSTSSGGKFGYDVEDFASALIRFESGLTLQVEASFNLNIKNDTGSIELFGTRSGAKLDPELELFTDMDGQFVNVKPWASSLGPFDAMFNAEIAHFIDCVRNGTECRSPAQDGVELMKILDAVYESAATGHDVAIG